MLLTRRLLESASARWAPCTLPLLTSQLLARSLSNDTSASAKPKRPLNAYMCFLKAEAPKVKASMPELKGLAVAKEVAARYQELKAKGGTSLSKYDADAAAAKEAYTAAMATWKQFAPAPTPAAAVVAASDDVHDKPKRALSAYQFFLKAESPFVKMSMPNLKGLAISKEATARYQALKAKGDASLSKFDADAAASKEAYTAAMAAWKQTAPKPSAKSAKK
jgi:hypothetical protein